MKPRHLLLVAAALIALASVPSIRAAVRDVVAPRDDKVALLAGAPASPTQGPVASPSSASVPGSRPQVAARLRPYPRATIKRTKRLTLATIRRDKRLKSILGSTRYSVSAVGPWLSIKDSRKITGGVADLELRPLLTRTAWVPIAGHKPGHATLSFTYAHLRLQRVRRLLAQVDFKANRVVGLQVSIGGPTKMVGPSSAVGKGGSK
jgi:hypothetical protein